MSATTPDLKYNFLKFVFPVFLIMCLGMCKPEVLDTLEFGLQRCEPPDGVLGTWVLWKSSNGSNCWAISPVCICKLKLGFILAAYFFPLELGIVLMPGTPGFEKQRQKKVLHTEFETSLGFVRSCVKTKTQLFWVKL